MDGKQLKWLYSKPQLLMVAVFVAMMIILQSANAAPVIQPREIESDSETKHVSWSLVAGLHTAALYSAVTVSTINYYVTSCNPVVFDA